MSQQTNPPTPSSTITMLGAEGPSTKSSPIHAADHIAMSAGGYSDSSHHRYQHATSAAANFGMGSSLDMPSSDPTSDISAFHYLVSSPSSGVFPEFLGSDSVRMLRRSTELQRRGSLSRSHPYIPEQHKARKVCTPPTKPRTIVIPAINQDGTLKKCTNCMTAETPSWRRHPDTQALLCNACGLYLRLHRKPRPITIDESGNVQVIRKNAAIQREPMNLPSIYAFGNPTLSSTSSLSSVASLGSASDASFDQPHLPHSSSLLFGSFNFPNCQLALRTNASLASIQGIAEPFSPLELYSPVPNSQQQGTYISIDDGTPALAFQNMLQISEVVDPENEAAVKHEDR
ncbi:hypothetical protein H4S04_001122 [Coemansia sp. S16]|nr:hypothetical protein H4S04_001122 [Coemansia sp. S16]